jgi:hypothetical protein
LGFLYNVSSDIQTQFDAINFAVGTNITNINSNTSAITGINTSISTANTNITTNTNNITTLQTQMATSNTNISGLGTTITTLIIKSTNQSYATGTTTFTGNLYVSTGVLTVESPIDYNTGCGMYSYPSAIGNCNTSASGIEKLIAFPSYGYYRVLINNNSKSDNRYQLHLNCLVSFKFVNITTEYQYSWWTVNNLSAGEQIGVSCTAGTGGSTNFSVYFMKLY